MFFAGVCFWGKEAKRYGKCNLVNIRLRLLPVNLKDILLKYNQSKLNRHIGKSVNRNIAQSAQSTNHS
jgi:hypothetical protein